MIKRPQHIGLLFASLLYRQNHQRQRYVLMFYKNIEFSTDLVIESYILKSWCPKKKLTQQHTFIFRLFLIQKVSDTYCGANVNTLRTAVLHCLLSSWVLCAGLVQPLPCGRGGRVTKRCDANYHCLHFSLGSTTGPLILSHPYIAPPQFWRQSTIS